MPGLCPAGCLADAVLTGFLRTACFFHPHPSEPLPGARPSADAGGRALPWRGFQAGGGVAESVQTIMTGGTEGIQQQWCPEEEPAQMGGQGGFPAEVTFGLSWDRGDRG